VYIQRAPLIDVCNFQVEDAVRDLHRKVPSSHPKDPAAALLFRELNVVGGQLRGTDDAKLWNRRECFALVPMFGPPTYFITINPADLHSPVMCHFAGADVKIGISDPDNPPMPTFAYRAHLVAHDPVACARFFHRVVTAFLTFLIGFDPEFLNNVEAKL